MPKANNHPTSETFPNPVTLIFAKISLRRNEIVEKTCMTTFYSFDPASNYTHKLFARTPSFANESH
jgi:hypothetical protein